MAEKTLRQQAADMLVLGSWHIYSRMTLDENVAFVKGALDRGITQFDVADYWDHEMLNTVRFKEVMKVLGLPRETYKIGLKVFTNSTESRDLVVRRMMELLDVEYVDSVLCSRPNVHETMQEAVEGMNNLIVDGLSKELDFSLWDAPQLKEAYDLMKAQGMNLPKFVQFQYNVCRRDVVESPAYHELFESTGLRLQAAFPLEGGILAGHVTRRRFGPEEREAGIWFHPEDRNLARDSGDIRQKIVEKVPRLIEVTHEMGISPATLSIAFAATHPYIHNVLMGASKLWQVDEALDGIEMALTDPAKVRAVTEEFYVGGSKPPKLFDMNGGMH